jgi:hypothetical protein
MGSKRGRFEAPNCFPADKPDPPSQGNTRGNIGQSSRAMAIVNDYAAISAEVHRIQAERSLQEKPAGDPRSETASQHRMRATIAGDLLYRPLVSQQARRQQGPRSNSDCIDMGG